MTGLEVTYARDGGVQLIDLGSGEMVDLRELTGDSLAELLRRVREHLAEARRVEEAVAEEVTRRLDLDGRRSNTWAGQRVRVNAPTRAVWDYGKTVGTVANLIEAERLHPRILDELVIQPMAPAPRIDGRVAHRLLEHPNPEVRAALSAVVQHVPAARKVELP